MIAVATENCKNDQACHTKDKKVDIKEYGELSAETQRLDEQMYVFLMAQFDQSNSEIIQHRSRAKEHPELALYSELILYLFHTKAGSPIHMWSTRQATISEIENKIPTDIKIASMSAMREGVGALLDVLETNSLKPWQDAVVKLHKHVVRTGCKDTTLALEQNVLNFLANAQEGEEVKIPNVRDWSNRALDGIEQNKEYYDARMASRKVIPRTLPHVHPESQKQPPLVKSNPTDPPKLVQAFDQGRDMVPGKCLKCKTDIVGPPHDRGGDQSKTWYKYCRDCHSAERRAKHRGQPRSIQQVEEVDDHHEPDGVFGPCRVDQWMLHGKYSSK